MPDKTGQGNAPQAKAAPRLMTRGRALLFALCCAGFALYGMYCNGFGTNAEATMAYFGIDEVKNGAILTVQSFGCLAAAVVLGLFGERLNKIYALAAGLVLLGAASLCTGLIPDIAPGAYAMMLGFALAGGVGYISVDLLTNSLIADVFREGKNRVLPYAHAFYGGGAMIAPVFVTALVTPELPESFARPYLLIGIAAVLVGVLLAAAGRGIVPETPYADLTAIRRRARQNPAEIFREGRAWIFLLSAFMNLCFQNGMTTWLPRYCSEVRGYDFTSAGLMVTVFFLGALIMRLLSPLVYAKIGPRRFYRGALLSSAVLFLVFLLVPMPDWAAALITGIMGLLQGATVPTLVIICCDVFPQRTASATSIVVFGVSLASMISPTAMGAVIAASGAQAAMLCITVCTVIAALALPRQR